MMNDLKAIFEKPKTEYGKKGENLGIALGAISGVSKACVDILDLTGGKTQNKGTKAVLAAFSLVDILIKIYCTSIIGKVIGEYIAMKKDENAQNPDLNLNIQNQDK